MQESTLHKLQQLEDRYEELQTQMADPDIMNDQNRYLEVVKESADLTDLIQCFDRYKKTLQNKEDCLGILEDSSADQDMHDLAQMELDEAKEKEIELENELIRLLQPKDPRDEKDIIMEIRAGAGGEEAALFASDLYAMYCSYAESQGFKVEPVDESATEIGGYKEISFIVSGKGAYSKFKFESGVHRVQRVPETESGGRIHTSTVTVAVMPEVDEVDFAIDPKDLKIDTYRASGAGGQHVNKTSSAIRITHLPTGVVVTCQDQRSQHKNKDRAMQVLRARLLEMEEEKRSAQIAGDRKSQIGTGDRSERIRTYNFPQGRVTDHRINLTLYKLDDILGGQLDALVDPLTAAKQAQDLMDNEY
jgi:peptide chain release factor 1